MPEKLHEANQRQGQAGAWEGDNTMSEQPVRSMMYRNRKTGKVYRRLASAIDTTNERDGLLVVIYCSEDDDEKQDIYVREAAEFEVKFKAEQGD